MWETSVYKYLRIRDELRSCSENAKTERKLKQRTKMLVTHIFRLLVWKLPPKETNGLCWSRIEADACYEQMAQRGNSEGWIPSV